MQQIASKNVTVLIRGETGAGQELIASLIHGTRLSALPYTTELVPDRDANGAEPGLKDQAAAPVRSSRIRSLRDPRLVRCGRLSIGLVGCGEPAVQVTARRTILCGTPASSFIPGLDLSSRDPGRHLE
jgi:Sigma-54 interaction domain